MTSPRAVLALAAGKSARAFLRATGRGGTSLPGLVALTVDGGVAGELSRTLPRGVACVTGTNGKTTTSRMLAAAAEAASWSVVHNRAGANLERGIAGALVERAGWGGAVRGDLGVFEIDEASLPRVLEHVAPRVLVVTNLFRDQLDRYHELDALARRLGESIALLPPSTILVANADDPLVVRIADHHPGTLVFF
ncbi:MAG: DUF1727 domain-containing protein, partial [Chloroflexi bacterium]|nr:DUF1727 domain-containing protein [Chloroflexota bacterium]